ncbi:MAG TPA: DNA-directed RNA polymerase subunit omega [Vicinamibacterales bacterium]|nr:DNA-directed RNA polymerase subunit omega [Vicinamibacterales bacterium]
MVDENTINEETPETTPAAPEPPAPPIESRFLFVDVAALRAKQLRRGARPRLAALANPETAPDVPHKAERIAMEEVRQGLVHYELPEAKPQDEEQPA